MHKAQVKLQLFPIDTPLAVFILSAILGILPAFNRTLVWTPLVILMLCGVLYLLVSRVAASIVRLMLTPFVVFEQPEKRKQHLILSNNYRRLLATLPGM